jgi:hypothetical protein
MEKRTEEKKALERVGMDLLDSYFMLLYSICSFNCLNGVVTLRISKKRGIKLLNPHETLS